MGTYVLFKREFGVQGDKNGQPNLTKGFRPIARFPTMPNNSYLNTELRSKYGPGKFSLRHFGARRSIKTVWAAEIE